MKAQDPIVQTNDTVLHKIGVRAWCSSFSSLFSIEATRTRPHREQRSTVLVVLRWERCGSFTYLKTATRVSLSPHSALKQARSSRPASRPVDTCLQYCKACVHEQKRKGVLYLVLTGCGGITARTTR